MKGLGDMGYVDSELLEAAINKVGYDIMID